MICGAYITPYISRINKREAQGGECIEQTSRGRRAQVLRPELRSKGGQVAHLRRRARLNRECLTVKDAPVRLAFSPSPP